MLEPQRMDKVLIVGTRDVMEATIDTLHDLDLLHIEDYTEEGAYFHIGKPLKSATSLSEKLLKLRSIRSHLKTKDSPYPKESRQKVLDDINAELASLERSLNDKMSEKSALESEVKDLARKKEALEPYVALGVPLELLYGYENVAVFVGTIPKDVEPIVSPVTKDYELFSAPYGNGNIIALYVPKAVSAAVSEALAKNDFIELEPLKEAGDPAELEKKASDRAAELEERLEAVGSEIKTLNERYGRFILASDELLTIDTQKAEAPLRFATSDNVFAIDGWVPVGELERLEGSLSKATGGRVYVTKVEPERKRYEGEVEPHAGEHHEINAPVQYDNPKWMYPLQAFIDLYSRPRYDEIDPTTIFVFTFPIFYGFILGDIGYGIVLLSAGLLVRRMLKNSEGWQILMNALIICAISSMFFGVLFGEFMGVNMAQDGLFGLKLPYPHEMHIGPIGPFAMPLERLVPGGFEHGSYVFGIKDLLVLTCIVGVVQILLGYVLGFVNEYRHHGLKTAILHKLSWIFVLLGGVAMVWYVFPLMLTQSMGAFSVADPLLAAGGVLFVAGLAMVIVGEGPMGIIEVPALMSNVLSYTRLLAVGLSSVGIALVINTIVGMMAGAGIIGIIAAIPILVLGHGINILLGIIAPGLHALRLHYVEFFTKFYQGGGKIYNPFGYKRKYTEE
jgi:V/A-type H+-transporting ATPase subunit I